MRKKQYSKYIRLLKETDLFNEFIPNAETIDYESEEVEAYTFYSSPDFIKGNLKSYQIEGLNWLIKMDENEINCILADEMGLGKTIQTISLLGYTKHVKKEKTTHLVVVPKSCLQNWGNEFEKFLPTINYNIFWCSQDDVRSKGKELIYESYDVIITTYEMCLIAKKVLSKISFNYLVVDEAHRLKNEESQLSQILRTYDFKHRLLLTGTPLQNNTHELWALLNFIVPDLFHDAEKFENYLFQAEKEKIEKIKGLISMFFLRREKSEVEQNLLPKKYLNIYASLTQMQCNWNKGILQKDI